MAIAKKCDVCNIYYDPYGYSESMQMNSITLESLDDTNDRSRPIASYDLCPNCSRRITNFIEILKDSEKEEKENA